MAKTEPKALKRKTMQKSKAMAQRGLINGIYTDAPLNLIYSPFLWQRRMCKNNRHFSFRLSYYTITHTRLSTVHSGKSVQNVMKIKLRRKFTFISQCRCMVFKMYHSKRVGFRPAEAFFFCILHQITESKC